MNEPRIFALCHRTRGLGQFSATTLVNAPSKHKAVVLYCTQHGLTLREQSGRDLWLASIPEQVGGTQYTRYVWIHLNKPDAR